MYREDDTNIDTNTIPRCFALRMWFISGVIYTRVFDDHEAAKRFMNIVVSQPNTKNAHLWEL